jgi:hypothetical protein
MSLLEQLPEKRAAPPAARPRAKAVAELRGALRLLGAKVVHHLPLRDVEAEAKFVIQIHG